MNLKFGRRKHPSLLKALQKLPRLGVPVQSCDAPVADLDQTNQAVKEHGNDSMRFRWSPAIPDLFTLVTCHHDVSLVRVFVCEYVLPLTVIDIRVINSTRCLMLLARALAGFHSQEALMVLNRL